MYTSSLSYEAKSFRSRLLTFSLLSAWLFSVGCVDLTKPWEKVTAQGGTQGGTSGGQGGAGGGMSDGPAIGTGGGGAGGTPGQEVGSALGGSGGVDAPLTSTGGNSDAPLSGTGGNSDAPLSGTGGDSDAPLSGTGGSIDTGTHVGSGGVLGSGGLGLDAPPLGSGGVTGGRDGGIDGAGAGTGGVVGTGGVPGTGGADPLLVGLLAYYPCDSATGTTLPDKSGKGNNGTLSAAGTSFAPSTAAKVGTGALILAKANSGFVTMPSAMFRGLTDITIATWVKVVTAQNWPRIFDIGINANVALNPKTGTNTNTYMNLVPQNETSQLVFAITKSGFPGEQQLANPTPSTGVWQHVAIVLSAGLGSLYINGVLAIASSSVALRPADLGAIDYAFIGKCQFSTDPYFDGQIDDFRVYNRALSASEAQALYQFTGP